MVAVLGPRPTGSGGEVAQQHADGTVPAGPLPGREADRRGPSPGRRGARDGQVGSPADQPARQEEGGVRGLCQALDPGPRDPARRCPPPAAAAAGGALRGPGGRPRCGAGPDRLLLGLEGPIPAARINGGRSGSYRERWDEMRRGGPVARRQRRRVEDLWGDAIGRFGYDLSDLTVLPDAGPVVPTSNQRRQDRA